jgi:hypothetical protein
VCSSDLLTGLSYNDYKLPASFQYSIGVQQELRPGMVLSLGYVGNQNRHQNDYRDINAPAISALPGLINGTVTYNTVLPYAGYHDIRMAENVENSHYNSFQATFRSQIGKDLSLQVAYTLARSIDPATSFGGDLYTVSNPYNRAYDNGPSMADRSNVGLVNFIYSVPLFNQSSRLVKTTLGGWQISGIMVAETGLPLNITLGGSQGANGTANGTNRPNFTGSATYPQTVTQWFNTSSFSSPAIGQWGTLTKGAIRAPGRFNWNLSLFKSFVFNDRGTAFEFRAESFNAFNHTQFNGISTSFSASNFGQVTSVWDPRVFQLGAKLLF